MGTDNKNDGTDFDAWLPEILSADWAAGKFSDIRQDFGRAFPRGTETGGAVSVKQEWAQGAAINLKDFGVK
jgi:hypothetical protein